MQKNKQESRVPFLANWLLSTAVRNGLHEEFLGDLEEIYQERITTKGRLYARLMYWVDVLHLLTGFGRLHFFKHQPNPTLMYKHYLTIAGRNLIRNKVYSLITILSLAVGMGVCLLIYQYNHFELSYDTFHSNAKNIYRVTRSDMGAEEGLSATVLDSYLLGPTAKQEIPEVKQAVRIMAPFGHEEFISNPDKDEVFREANYFFVDPEFLQVFDFPLISGNRESALKNINNVVITEKMARKYFGSANPLGKTLKVTGGVFDVNSNVTVTGVLKNLPANSHLQFDFLFPLEKSINGFVINNGWALRGFSTYIYVDKSVNLSALAGKFNNIIKARAGKKVEPQVSFQPLTGIHLGGNYDGDPATGNGDMQNVKLFFIIAFFILLIAWVNYINLSTAYALQRAKEVGIRKSIGAFKSQLMGQFILESLLVNIFAALLAIGTAYLALPVLNYIIGKELVLDLLTIPSFWLQFIGLVILGSLLSGVYPALVLSSFKPITMLKRGIATRAGGFNLRRSLIVFQFILSLLLISGTYLVYNQISYMKNQDIGVDMQRILVVKEPQINLNFDEYLAAKELFKDKLKSHHSISAATGSTQIPGRAFNWTRKEIYKLGEPINSKLFADIIYVDGDFLDTYDFTLLAQDSISKKAITNRRVAFINEEAVRVYGFGSPEKAMHQKLILFKDTVTIAGVLKNFHWQSLREEHTPVILDLRRGYRSYFSIKMTPSNIQETLTHVESTYRSIYPGNPFEYFFLNDDFNQQYQADLQFRNLFAAFSALAILIACTGLFALISFSATRRTKEIGIRKVLGASVGNVMVLLTKEYLFLLSIAIGIAIPLILYGGRLWLNNYAFRTAIGPSLIIIPALFMVLISVLTVGYRTFTAARANPVQSLRTE